MQFLLQIDGKPRGPFTLGRSLVTRSLVHVACRPAKTVSSVLHAAIKETQALECVLYVTVLRLSVCGWPPEQE